MQRNRHFSGFHSLQAGTHIQTRAVLFIKKNGVWSFHSLQAGRHIQTATLDTPRVVLEFMFPFPSSGKAHSDGDKIRVNLISVTVSIPFKRERTVRHKRSQRHTHSRNSFNSLQTGTHSQTRNHDFKEFDEKMFPFPSNGKAQSDYSPSRATRPSLCFVSIPFKREGTVRPRTRQNRARTAFIVSIPFKRKAHSD